MKLISVEKSERPAKKWKATFDMGNGKVKSTHFGSAGMDDFTLTGNKDARNRYWRRHHKDMNTNDPTRAGFLSLFLLWNKPTLKASIKDYVEIFDL